MNLKKGFTLIELLVVIAIIGILSGIAITFLNGARMAARDARVIANLKQFSTLAELSRDSSGKYDMIALTLTNSFNNLDRDTCSQQGNPCNGTIHINLGPNPSPIKYTGINIFSSPTDKTKYCAYSFLPSVANGGMAVCTDSTGITKTKVPTPSNLPCNAAPAYTCK